MLLTFFSCDIIREFTSFGTGIALSYFAAVLNVINCELLNSQHAPFIEDDQISVAI